jgi:hypothetical protein
MKTQTAVPRGRLVLEVRALDGTLVAERRAGNLVLRRGAEIVASLFAGAPDAGPIDRIRVGFGRESADVGATALTPPEDGALGAEALERPVEQDDFDIETDAAARLVRVSIAATFSPSVDLEDVSEAGLLAGETLYNQVVFEPVAMSVGQEVTFFWEVDFPFGH